MELLGISLATVAGEEVEVSVGLGDGEGDIVGFTAGNLRRAGPRRQDYGSGEGAEALEG